MSQAVKVKNEPRRVYRRVRFPGITQFASAHGYNYTSVYRHLTGDRPSMTIARKWAAWQRQRGA